MGGKGFFYIPTYMLIILCFVSISSLGFELFFFLNIDAFETITVNGIEYQKGTEEYQSGIQTMQLMFMISAGITLIFSIVTGFFAIKRIKKSNNATHTDSQGRAAF